MIRPEGAFSFWRIGLLLLKGKYPRNQNVREMKQIGRKPVSFSGREPHRTLDAAAEARQGGLNLP